MRDSEASLFVQIVAHELRAPVCSAFEALRLSRSASSERKEKLFDMAAQSLRAADRMISELRHFAMAEGEAAPATTILVKELLSTVLEEIELQMRVHAWSIQLDPQLGKVLGSRPHLAHIFRNLVLNALVHNRGVEGLVVEVGRKSCDQPTFYVRDNGHGIKAEDQDRIFQPFKKSRQSRNESMGLGLALVRSLTRQTGGCVWVESEPGSGATFWFTFGSPVD